MGRQKIPSSAFADLRFDIRWISCYKQAEEARWRKLAMLTGDPRRTFYINRIVRLPPRYCAELIFGKA